jgi:hypothetical protein
MRSTQEQAYSAGPRPTYVFVRLWKVLMRCVRSPSTVICANTPGAAYEHPDGIFIEIDESAP